MRIANKILQNKGFYYIIILLGMFLITQTCFAQALENPLGKDATFAELIGKVADIVMQVGGVAAVVMIIWSGFLFVTARGSDEQLKKAKSTFQWTIIGAVVLLGSSAIAKAIVNFVKGLK